MPGTQKLPHCTPARGVVLYRPWAPGSVGYNRDKASKGHTLRT